jgi:uracil-DNA glycosylase
MDDRDAIGSVEELHRRLEPCRLCVKAGIRVESMPVFSRLHRADAILVGQAPGIREAVDRRPFIGPAGRRLRAWLEPAGLGTEEEFYGRLYIAAVAKCFPGKRPGGSDVRPSPAMVRTCRPWLWRELALIDAPLVVAVGTLALAELAPGVPLEDAVGVEMRLEDGRPLISLPHPSGASPWPHLPGNAPRLARALELLADRLGSPA